MKAIKSYYNYQIYIAPLADRNPQKYVENIYKAKAKDYVKATHKLYHSKKNSSFIEIGILN